MRTLSTTLSLALLLAVSGCMNQSGWNAVSGSGKVLTEPRTVAGFNKVAVTGGGKLTITQGEQEALTIRADDNLLPLIETSVVNGELRIESRHNMKPTQTILYDLKVKDLRAVELSGSLQIEAAQLKSDNFRVQISGSGDVRIGHLDARRFEVEVAGSGDVSVAGRVTEQAVNISGSGDYKAGDLESDQATAHVSGSGSLTLWAKKSLASSVSGSGDISYYGSPNVDSHTAGSGHVRSLGAK